MHRNLPRPRAWARPSPPDWTRSDTRRVQAQLSDEWSDITAKLAKAASEIRRRQAEIATARDGRQAGDDGADCQAAREADFHQLADQGFVASHAGQDRTRERIELERDLATQRARLAEANATLRESENTRSAYIAETLRTASGHASSGRASRDSKARRTWPRRASASA
jgi:hemolysin D